MAGSPLDRLAARGAAGLVTLLVLVAPAWAAGKKPASPPAAAPTPATPVAAPASSTPQVATANPHGAFKEDCAMCHRADSWKPAKPTAEFDHSKYGFPLEGSHKDVPCLLCHKSLDFATTAGNKCASCHQDVHQGEMGNECARCHTTRDFIDRAEAVRRHRLGRFPLTGSHLTTDCASCHRPLAGSAMKFAGTPETCEECHLEEYKNTTNPNHVTSGFSTDCAGCHNTATFVGGAFDHSTTRFPLTGAHAAVNCQQCHGDGPPAAVSMECASCHRGNYDATTDPPHATVGMSTDCASCHNTTAWPGATFDHGTTAFPLTGAHTSTSCVECHGGTPGTPPSTLCVSCHRSDYDATATPNHASVGFPTDCASCHGTTSWDGASFDHSVTGFPLTGQHTTTDCASCHGTGAIGALDPQCVSCHRSEYDGTTDPNHATVGFNTDCASCHGTSTWTDASFNHNTTGFPLTGAHTTTNCASCHGGTTGPPSPECVACHQANYDATTNPNHASIGFPTDCAMCHGTTNWDGASFDHSITGFPITGQHVGVQCASCHGGGAIGHVDPMCVSCHRSEYDATTDPGHAAVGFDTDCASCHSAAGWEGATFDHATTGFPLTGQHTTTSCAQCHGGTGTPSPECVTCHRSEYDGTTDPDHAEVGFNTDCASCHNTTAWPGATFNHNTTGFPLTGAHTTTSCAQCHGGVTGPPSPECVACHRADYDGTTSPNHATSGFPTDCATCHGTSSWDGASFDHATTGFPLTGMHVGVECASCHGGGAIGHVDPECVSCHRANYDATTDPDHANVGFSTDCASCHNANGWDGATFNHNTTGFPLTGAHTTTSCAQCHGGTATPSPQCVGCHRPEYDATTDPAHAPAGFPTDCQACHGTTTWTGATFDHDGPYFPIYSGRHRGVWSTCAECHNQPTDYSAFECILCHEHSNKSRVDADHRGRSGYSYDSAACYRCHPNGRS